MASHFTFFFLPLFKDCF